MDGSSSAPPSDSNSTADGVSKYLAGLPSRGLFTSTLLSSNPGGMRVYVCEHDTSPPEDQLIKTNQMNILIRSLVLKKQKVDSSSKDIKGTATNEASRKRPTERALDGRASAKRAVRNSQVGSQQEESKSHVSESKSHVSEKDIPSLTVERIRALLKEKGLPVRGKKAELIARLRGS